LHRVVQDSATSSYYARRFLPFTLAPFDLELSDKLQADLAGINRESGAGGMISMALEVNRNPSPAYLRQLLPRAEQAGNATEKITAWATLGLAALKSDPALAEELYGRVSAALKQQGLTPPPGNEYYSVFNYGRAAALSA
jgi:hypothetical protein